MSATAFQRRRREMAEAARKAETSLDYDDMTVPQLKEHAEKAGIEGFNTMRKQELIEALKG